MKLDLLFPFTGYSVKHFKIYDHPEKRVRVFLDRKDDKPCLCHVCGTPMARIHSRDRCWAHDLGIADFKTTVHFKRFKARCSHCRKVRLESVDFLASETLHTTKRLSMWLGAMCEFAAVSRVAEFASLPKQTLWRADLLRMQEYFSSYEIPASSHISVDEVYARAWHGEDENNYDRYFTLITDLDAHKVVWVEESRSKAALDRYFQRIGEEGRKRIKVVAIDQHEEYVRSIAEHVPHAATVFDRFHLMKTFEEAANETRKRLFKMLPGKDVKEIARGRNRFVFLKAASKRTAGETTLMETIQKNQAFLHLELIKERMISLFSEMTADEARTVFDEIGSWIVEAGFPELKKWWVNLNKVWDTVANFFKFRVTTSLSEGINNVVKSIKRRAFGFRNMDYFRLKIMQVCGLMNSQYMNQTGGWTPKGLALLADIK